MKDIRSCGKCGKQGPYESGVGLIGYGFPWACRPCADKIKEFEARLDRKEREKEEAEHPHKWIHPKTFREPKEEG